MLFHLKKWRKSIYRNKLCIRFLKMKFSFIFLMQIKDEMFINNNSHRWRALKAPLTTYFAQALVLIIHGTQRWILKDSDKELFLYMKIY
ncbi:MAG: hypothetical protein ACD_3C00193G0004 [uncultured bacterium (gcode 4)]|uniref:Uncharacterized protein n=1 Tax=uncultured bacterium (gcode 4) TaxID=1234023 RepID=K2F8T5_9BACT|nr:MAG: hypothetical protein ACD_3C00193G0004 [uncultured bacterium (gcode 4)]